MGGGGWFYVPKVWTPAGGWWPTPTAWKRNTGIAYVVGGLMCAYVAKISASKERRPLTPYKPLFSEKWCKHAPGQA